MPVDAVKTPRVGYFERIDEELWNDDPGSLSTWGDCYSTVGPISTVSVSP